MKLKSIKINGFKSFADKADIEINDGITGIVGPNGSGKSNIVDAVKWVLGEQSVKAIRGAEGMTDVIFQGSSSRKPLTRASVTLCLDNTDHSINIDYKDIEVKRVVYASGENEYYINSSRVRHKDITNLFLDSFAGSSSVGIISQGKIGEIVGGTAQERRAVIEEAAGVLKYKKRKIESLKKLEKTNDNLNKIDLVINELEGEVLPLEQEAKKAEEYQSLKKELEAIEVELLVSDITTLNNEYREMQGKSKTLKEETENLTLQNGKSNAEEEKNRLELLALENEINSLSQKLLALTENISKLEAKRQVAAERQKYEVSDIKLANNIMELKESLVKFNNQKEFLEQEIENLKEESKNINDKIGVLDTDVKKYTASKLNIVSETEFKNRMLGEYKNKLDIVESNIQNDTSMPYPVKSVINNLRLKGIHGTIGKKLEIEDKYRVAISTALGSLQNVIICDDEICAKEAINYLKDNKLGRATFYPLNVIKPKYIDKENLSIIEKEQGFVGRASDLVTYDTKFKNIVLNTLGNIVVVQNLEVMNKLGKKINYSYRIVTLDGELLHTGGAITGGVNKSNRDTISEKQNRDRLIKEIDTITESININNKKLDKINEDISIVSNEKDELMKALFKTDETLKIKEDSLDTLLANIKSSEDELEGINAIKNGEAADELESILKVYYEAKAEKKTLEEKLETLKNKKSLLNEHINEQNLINKKINSDYNKKVSELNKLEVELGKYDIKLDNLLLRLTDEYDMTYEKAKSITSEREVNDNDRSKALDLRGKIKSLGDVNTGAIAQFERMNERYTFLKSQRKDLSESIEDILKIITEMDDTMKSNFKDTFEHVNEEFGKVFKLLFKGGTGKLVLTNPDDLLETGVEIIAEPPGKKLKNISLLSGGEKTLTAIALLFAIINVKPVPFCLLDEVEAALDEANVETFGNYLKDYGDKTQFLVITHKKKTMEYANTLYGITMQESGVSKLVSVRLEDIKKG